jgi:hypothetical protein
MIDWTNQLPTPSELMHKLDEIAAFGVEKLPGYMVIVIVTKEDGKCGTTVAGIPETGPLFEMSKSPASMLATIALACKLQEEIAMHGVKS